MTYNKEEIITQGGPVVLRTQAECDAMGYDVTLPKGKMVVAVFLGTETSQNKSIDIKDVFEGNDKIVVEYCVTPAISTCYMDDMRIIPLRNKPITFKDVTPKALTHAPQHIKTKPLMKM